MIRFELFELFTEINTDFFDQYPRSSHTKEYYSNLFFSATLLNIFNIFNILI